MPQRKKIKRFQRTWAAIIITLVCFQFVNAIVSYNGINELVASEKRANRTKIIIRTIKDFYSSVQDAELGLRGFLLSGDESYLEPYYKSVEKITFNLEKLKKYDYKLEGHDKTIERLEKLIENRLQEMRVHIPQREMPGHTFLLSKEKMSDSHESMRMLSKLIAEMEEAEYELLYQQSRLARAAREKVKFTIIISNAIGLILIFGVALLVRNVVSRQRAESEMLERMVEERTEKLEHYSKELQQSNRELQDFAFVASHDLQEPLRKIRAFGDRLKKNYSAELGEGADYVNRMENAAARMSVLIDDLLAFSRVSTKAKPFELADLNEIVTEVLETFDLKIEECDAQVIVEELPELEVDVSQMRQLFQNIIGNSLKFSRENVPPIIRIFASEELKDHSGSDYYLISVEDNGIGFEEKYLEKIFTPFQRLHGRGVYEGTGIGLAICRKIVERHQGQITAESEVGKGTVFQIRLPKNVNEQAVSSLELDS